MIVARISTVNGSCTIPGYDKKEDRWFVVESIDFGFEKEDPFERVVKRALDGGKDTTLQKKDSSRETTITITKSIDAASCDLMFQAMSDRFHAPGSEQKTPIVADIHFVQNLDHEMELKGGRQQKGGVIAYLRIAMETVKVKSWNISASADGRPSETVTLWFEQLAMRFQHTVDGRVYKDAGERGWNQRLDISDPSKRAWLPRESNKYFHLKYYPNW